MTSAGGRRFCIGAAHTVFLFRLVCVCGCVCYGFRLFSLIILIFHMLCKTFSIILFQFERICARDVYFYLDSESWVLDGRSRRGISRWDVTLLNNVFSPLCKIIYTIHSNTYKVSILSINSTHMREFNPRCKVSALCKLLIPFVSIPIEILFSPNVKFKFFIRLQSF